MFSNTTRAAAPRLTQQLLAASVLAIASVAAIATALGVTSCMAAV